MLEDGREVNLKPHAIGCGKYNNSQELPTAIHGERNDARFRPKGKNLGNSMANFAQHDAAFK